MSSAFVQGIFLYHSNFVAVDTSVNSFSQLESQIDIIRNAHLHPEYIYPGTSLIDRVFKFYATNDFPDMVSVVQLALKIKNQILNVSKSALLVDNNFRDYATLLRREIANLALDPNLTQKRISKTRDRFWIPIDECRAVAYVKPLRSCWITKNVDKKSIEVQMIHSGPEAFVGEGSFKKVKLSAHFTISLESVNKAERILSKTTVLLRSSSRKLSESGALRILNAGGSINLIKNIEDELATGPNQVFRKIQDMQADVANYRNELQLAGLGEMRSSFLKVSKEVIVDSVLVTVQKKKLEMEERLFSGDFHEIHKKLPFLERIQVLLDVTKALRKLHEHGIVHRDVKASNILVDVSGGSAKGYLSDFDQRTTIGNDPVISPYVYWDSGTRRGYVTRAPDIYGLAMTIGDSFIGRPFSDFQLLQSISEDPVLSHYKDLRSFFSKAKIITEFGTGNFYLKYDRELFKVEMIKILETHDAFFLEVLENPEHAYHLENTLKSIKSLHATCKHLLECIKRACKYPTGPILDDAAFGSLLSDTLANLVIGTFKKWGNHRLADDTFKMLGYKNVCSPTKQYIEKIDEAIGAEPISREELVDLETCRSEIIAVTKLHQFVREVVAGNKVLLDKMESNKHLDFEEIESCFPTMKDCYDLLKDIGK